MTSSTIQRSISTLGALLGAETSPSPGVIRETSINRNWKFSGLDAGELNAHGERFDDATWDTVCLPHTLRIEKFDETHPWQGVCWYRRQIDFDPAWDEKRILLRFGAAMQNADVWVNGAHVCRHLGGYLPFGVDLSGAFASGRAAVAVRVDNRDTDIVPPGKPTNDLDFNYPGGLYRGVDLVVIDQLHISDPIVADIVAGGGVFVRYENVSAERATVLVKTDVANDSGELARNVTVGQRLVDAAGDSVAETLNEPVMIGGTAHHEFSQKLDVVKPRLWHPDHPHLHTLITTVMRDGVIVDVVSTRIGIRSIELGKRVVINGEVVRVVGTNRHQEYPYIGYAVSPNAARRDAQRIKDGGFNHVRLAHYPQDPAFLDACDELGLLVQAPIPGWQIFHYNSSFVNGSYQNIRDLIRRDRNHPCILFWEPNLNETWGEHLDWCRTAHEIAHQEYPGQMCFTFGDDYPEGWVPGWDVKAFVREYGDFGFGGNESTSRHTRGEGEMALLQQAWNYQWCHNDHWGRFEDPANTFQGDATWVMFDYNRGYYSKPCTCGMMDIFRLPKYVYYFYQSQRDPGAKRDDIANGPMVFIASDWTPRPSGGKVIVYSNCDEVELTLNGKAIARQRPDSGPDSKYSDWDANIAATVGNQYDNSGGHPFDGGNCAHLDHPPFTFTNVAFEPGELRAIAYLDGKPVTEHVVRTPGQATRLAVEFDTQRTPLAADGADTIFVRVSVLDDAGTVVPAYELTGLKVNVAGPARLIGTEPIHVEAGIASVLLQATANSGEITVTALADGIQGTTAALTSFPA